MSVLSAWDHQLLTAINVHLHHPMVMAWMYLLTRGGEPQVVLAVVAVSSALAWRRHRREALAGGLGLLAALALAEVVKGLVNRPRPAEVFHTLYVVPEGLGRSFPSGHATAAFALAALLSVCWPRGRLLWWAMALGVAWSRIYLGLHFPSDCAGGAVLGAGLVWGAVWVGWRLGPRGASSPLGSHNVT